MGSRIRTERLEVKVKVVDREVCGSIIKQDKHEDDALTDFIAWLQSKLAAIPDEFKASARVEFETTGYEGATPCFGIYYFRNETDEEYAQRIDRERAFQERKKIQRRSEYEQLKKEFEGGK